MTGSKHAGRPLPAHVTQPCAWTEQSPDRTSRVPACDPNRLPSRPRCAEAGPPLRTPATAQTGLPRGPGDSRSAQRCCGGPGEGLGWGSVPERVHAPRAGEAGGPAGSSMESGAPGPTTLTLALALALAWPSRPEPREQCPRCTLMGLCPATSLRSRGQRRRGEKGAAAPESGPALGLQRTQHPGRGEPPAGPDRPRDPARP